MAALVAVTPAVAAAQERPVRRIDIPALVTAVAFSPDGSALTAWDPGGFSRWDASTGRRLDRELVIAKPCERDAVLPRSEDGRVVAAQCRNRLLFFDAATGQALGDRQLPDKQTAAIYTAAASGKATAIILAGATDVVRLGGLSGGPETEVRIGNEIEQITLAADGSRFTAGTWRGVEVRDVTDGALLHTIEGTASHAMSADGRMVAATSARGPKLIDVATGRVLRELEGGVSYLRFSPDGGSLVGWTNQRVVVWDVATGARRMALTGDEFVGAAVSPDRTRLVTITLERRGEGGRSILAVWRLP